MVSPTTSAAALAMLSLFGCGSAAVTSTAAGNSTNGRRLAWPGPTVVAGDKNTAILKGGDLWVTGRNVYGDLGLGDKTERLTFEHVMSGVQGVSFGRNFAVALQSDGSVLTAGSNQHNVILGLGEIGEESASEKLTFTKVLTTGVQAVHTGGSYFTLIEKEDGSVWAVGYNNYGQYGDGSKTARNTFHEISVPDVQEIRVGAGHAAVLKTDGSVWTVGSGSEGELGDGGRTERSNYQKVWNAGAAEIQCGDYKTMVLTSSGELWITGNNGYGQLGDGSTSMATTFKSVATDVAPLSLTTGSSGQQTGFLKNDGSVWLAGRGHHGVFGDGGRTQRSTYHRIMPTETAQAMSVGGTAVAVVKPDGTVWQTGGEGLGVGQTGDQYTFSEVFTGMTPFGQTPTPAPTTAALPAAGSVSGSGGSPASAKGDPHLQNINGQRFDLMRPGTHVLLHIPRGADAPHVLLRVEAEVQRMGPQCGDMYFHDLNITGGWVKAKQGAPIQFHAGEIDGAGVPAWMTFGEVDLKVVHGHNHFGIYYLNLYVKHLGRTRLKVGGLLGEDDHEYEATPEEGCVPTVNLDASDLQHHVARLNMPSASFAEANLA